MHCFALSSHALLVEILSSIDIISPGNAPVEQGSKLDGSMAAAAESVASRPAKMAPLEKKAKPPLHYPFWFGGSASSMAACVTHPLDLGPSPPPSPFACNGARKPLGSSC